MSGKVFALLSGIVTVATITAVVSSPNSADVIRALGSAFSSSISSALGQA